MKVKNEVKNEGFTLISKMHYCIMYMLTLSLVQCIMQTI